MSKLLKDAIALNNIYIYLRQIYLYRNVSPDILVRTSDNIWNLKCHFNNT